MISAIVCEMSIHINELRHIRQCGFRCSRYSGSEGSGIFDAT